MITEITIDNTEENIGLQRVPSRSLDRNNVRSTVLIRNSIPKLIPLSTLRSSGDQLRVENIIAKEFFFFYEVKRKYCISKNVFAPAVEVASVPPTYFHFDSGGFSTYVNLHGDDMCRIARVGA